MPSPRSRTPRSSVLVATLLALSLGSGFPAAQGTSGLLHGVVADPSGGVLPGVTVAVTATDGPVLATVVTDEVGSYCFRALPALTVRLTFQLEGFTTETLDVGVTPDVDLPVATLVLRLAGTSETVEVHGTAPIVAPSVVRRQPPPPAPRPVVRPVPDHDRDSICGPAKPGDAGEIFGTIRSRRAAGNGLYAAGDELVIDGGTVTGLEIGQNVVAARSYRTSSDPGGTKGEHTAGLLQIVEVSERASLAVVVYACDELLPGDRLASFRPEPVRPLEPAGVPSYDRAAQILLTDAGQLIGAPRRLMVIDRGRDNGIRVGQRLTLFRRSHLGAGRPSIIGEAVVVALRMDSATIRVQGAADVIELGDWAAPQRPHQAPSPTPNP